MNFKVVSCTRYGFSDSKNGQEAVFIINFIDINHKNGVVDSLLGDGVVQICKALCGNMTLTELAFNKSGITPELAVLMSDHITNLCALKKFEILDNEIGDDGAAALSNILSLTSLVELNFNKNLIGLLGIEAISSHLKNNSTLTQLSLGSNDIDDDSMLHLGSAISHPKCNLQTLHIFWNEFDLDGVMWFCKYLETNTSLKKLDLYHNRIDCVASRYIGMALAHNTTLTELDLLSNQIGPDGIKHIGEGLKKNTVLTNLDLGSNLIGCDGSVHLADSIAKNSGLKTLYLDNNAITSQGTKLICEALKTNCTLQQVFLSRNALNVEGGMELANAIKNNTSLTIITASWNGLSDEGIKSIFEALQYNKYIKELYIRDNNITRKGAKYIGNYLSTNSTLVALNLDSNSINDRGSYFICDALKTNTTLTTLDLSMNSITVTGMKHAIKSLNYNFTLQDLGVNGIGSTSDSAEWKKKLRQSLNMNKQLNLARKWPETYFQIPEGCQKLGILLIALSRMEECILCDLPGEIAKLIEKEVITVWPMKLEKQNTN
eukprot:TRINITY_DN5906_c0_g1_i2.p1 TRINITY_DN5906_c0_g1~~TRINITY_DN5906_c0_g1_i2.p1  ORF type:complete len:547 (+),score=70.42 TRINITY_DN5906_c0_g1_i2:1459-3099(+)